MKKFLRIIFISVAIYPFLFCMFWSIQNRFKLNNEYNDCGRIRSRSADEVTIKHGTRTELYLNIDFDKSGFKSIEVNPTTYFRHTKGDRVCFTLSNDVPYRDVTLFGNIFFYVCIIIVAILIIIVVFDIKL